MTVTFDEPVITTVTSAIETAYQSSRLSTTRRIQIFESDAITPWSPDNIQSRLIDGDISVDSSRDERRSLNLTLDNKDGLLRHDPIDGLWYDKIIKVYRGLIYPDGDSYKKFEIQIGEFMIDNLNSQRFPGHISLSGRDYTKKLLLDQFAVDTAFAAGQSLDSLVKVIANNGGITKYRLSAPGITVGTGVAFARNSSRWEGIKSLCEGLNVEVYFDREGYLVTRPYDDVSTTAPYFELSLSGSRQNIIDFSKSSSDTNIFNHVIVTGTSEEETVTGYRYIAILENNDANSPTNISRIGRRTFNFEVNYITSQQQANDLCRRLLDIKQLEDFNLEFSSVCIPWLEAGRVLVFHDPEEDASVPSRFLFSSFTIPLKLGAMTGSGKRIVIIGEIDPDLFVASTPDSTVGL